MPHSIQSWVGLTANALNAVILQRRIIKQYLNRERDAVGQVVNAFFVVDFYTNPASMKRIVLNTSIVFTALLLLLLSFL